MRTLLGLLALALFSTASPFATATGEAVCVDDVRAEFVSSTSQDVNVTWSLVDGASHYDVYMSVDGGAFANMGTAEFVGGEPGRGAMGFGGYTGTLTFSIAVDGIFSATCPTASIVVPGAEVPFFPSVGSLVAAVALSCLAIAGVVMMRQRA